MTDLAYEVEMIEYDILVAEQCASRLAEEFWKETLTGAFINWGRIEVQDSLRHLRVNQPNEFFEKLVVNTFKRRLKELEKEHAAV